MTARGRRRVGEATATAALLSAVPSAFVSLWRHRALAPVARDLLEETRAAGTILPPGRAGLVRGSLVHLGVSVLCGQALARALPRRRSVLWGGAAGLAIGVFNLTLVGRRFAAVRALPLLPQLADNVAFGVIFAVVADR